MSLDLLINLLLNVKCQLPGGVVDDEFLALLSELVVQLLKEVVRTVMREESVGASLLLDVVLAGEADNLEATVGVLGIVVAKVDLAIELDVTAGSVADLGALSVLALLLLHGSVLVDLMAARELFADSISRGDSTVSQPWVSNDISDTETLVRVELKHASEKILELLRVEALRLALGVGVSLPEEVGSVGGEKLVVVVLLVGHGEGWVTGVKDEEDDTKGEKIDNLSLVWLSGENLWGHVTWGTNDRSVSSGAIATLKRASEAEIDDLNVIHLVEKDVLWLEISVGEALGVDVVNTLKHLLEEVLADLLAEGARVGDVVEELTASDHLLSDVGYLNLLSTRLGHSGAFLKFEVLDHVLMVKLRGGINLLLEKLEGTLVKLWVIEAEDLEGILSTVLGGSELDLGRETGAKSSSESESVKCCGHYFA